MNALAATFILACIAWMFGELFRDVRFERRPWSTKEVLLIVANILLWGAILLYGLILATHIPEPF